MRMTANRKEKVKELKKLVEKYGYYLETEDIIFAHDNSTDIELMKKAYGDGWSKYTSEYFDVKDYKKLNSLCKQLKIETPEYVYAD